VGNLGLRFLAFLGMLVVFAACTTLAAPQSPPVTFAPVQSETATPQTTDVLVYFQEANAVISANAVTPDAFEVKLDGNQFFITWNGDKALPKANSSEQFNLELEDYFFVTRAWITRYEGDWILVYDVSDMDVSGGFIARFSGADLSPIWTTKSFGAHSGEPIIRGQAVYVTGLNSVSKLSLRSGEHYWKRGIPTENNAREFFAFERPTFEAGQVILKGANDLRTAFEQVRVDDTNGAIINIATTINP
jgi:hypothetical protein